jgi:hypothetical protein
VSRRQSKSLTKAQLRKMNVLWLKGSGTVQVILDFLSQRPPMGSNGRSRRAPEMREVTDWRSSGGW